jgi:NADH-ubiquinone oxidoreductase chain 3
MNNLIFTFIFVPFLSAVLLALNVLLAKHKPDEAKVSAYECGFTPIFGQTRSTFQIHFMIVALLFLIFDLEILLLFPLAVSLYQVSIFGFTIGIIFFIILTIGFVLEIGSGAIALTNINISSQLNNK